VTQDRARDESQEDSEMADVSTMPGDAGATVWLWQWNRDTGELEKVGVPADTVPPEWVEPLQRRYGPGDRVLYTIDDEHGWQPGTVVMDQGVYVAIDGDAPGRYATTPKMLIRPLGEEPSTPSGPPAPPTTVGGASPHGEPEMRTSDRCINARWPLGGPVAAGAQWQASLTVQYFAGGGYRAVVRTVLEQRTAEGIAENWSYSNPSAVVYEQSAPRYSAKRLREAYHAALDALRNHFAAGDPVITGFFTVPASCPPDEHTPAGFSGPGD
jgi:hypothetical protein